MGAEPAPVPHHVFADQLARPLVGGKARVDIKMKPDFPLFIDAAIGKRASSLIGESIIVLTQGTEGQPKIPNDGQITHYMDEPTIQTIQGQVADVLKDVKAVTETLKNTVGSNQGQRGPGDRIAGGA